MLKLALSTQQLVLTQVSLHSLGVQVKSMIVMYCNFSVGVMCTNKINIYSCFEIYYVTYIRNNNHIIFIMKSVLLQTKKAPFQNASLTSVCSNLIYESLCKSQNSFVCFTQIQFVSYSYLKCQYK